MSYEFSSEFSINRGITIDDFPMNVLIFVHVGWGNDPILLGSFEWVHQLHAPSMLARFETLYYYRTGLVCQKELIWFYRPFICVGSHIAVTV